jgi:hypothetical protein
MNPDEILSVSSRPSKLVLQPCVPNAIFFEPLATLEQFLADAGQPWKQFAGRLAKLVANARGGSTKKLIVRNDLRAGIPSWRMPSANFAAFHFS